MGKRSRSRSPKDKKSKRKNSSNSSDQVVKKDKHHKKNGKHSKHEDKHDSPFTMETRSRKNSDVAGFNDGQADSKIKAKEIVSAPNPGDFQNFPEIQKKTIEQLIARGILSLFPVQYMTFRNVYNREDLIVRDLTGSGKTLGFSLPMIEYLRANKLFGTGQTQAIILAPTRELALQITRTLTDLKHYEKEYNVITVYGGTSISDQTYQLRKGVDIFVGTTGRVLDHMDRGNLNFQQLKFMILDEADQMLKLGFKEDVDRILATVKETCKIFPQFLLFSATVPSWIKDMANSYLKPNWQMIDLAKNLKDKTQKNINHISINCPYHNRMQTLADILVIYGGLGQTIVFCQTKAEANDLLLSEKINKDIEVMHGDIAQNQREVTLKRFKEQKFSVLVATDVASRGLDIPNVDLVIQVEPPKDVETYIHRAGRTARAGKTGTCITFWTMKHKYQLQTIENRAGFKFTPIGIPQPQDVLRATSRDTIKQLQTVNTDVLPLFNDAADELIALSDGDQKAALLKALAFISGCHKEKLQQRSLLTGQEKCITFQLSLENEFHGVGLVWNILRRYLPETITTKIKGMRLLQDKKGAVFDVEEDQAQQFKDIFDNLQQNGRQLDFKIFKSLNLPELFDSDKKVAVNTQYNGRGSNFGGQQFGGGRGGSNSFGGRQQNGGGQSRSRNQDASVFVGNLAYTADSNEITNMFSQKGIRPVSVRVLMDEYGKSKGSAFVDFQTPDDAKKACSFDGQQLGGATRNLRINSAQRS